MYSLVNIDFKYLCWTNLPYVWHFERCRSSVCAISRNKSHSAVFLRFGIAWWIGLGFYNAFICPPCLKMASG